MVNSYGENDFVQRCVFKQAWNNSMKNIDKSKGLSSIVVEQNRKKLLDKSVMDLCFL